MVWPKTAFAVKLDEDARGNRGIVFEQDQGLAGQRLVDEGLLRGQRVHRIQVEAHAPRVGQVRRRGHEIGDVGGPWPPDSIHDHLVMRRVTARALHPHARHDRLILVHQLQDAGLGQRQKLSGQIAGPVALVRVRRVLPFAATHDVARRGKLRPDMSRLRRAP